LPSKYHSVPSNPLPKIIKTENVITPENAVRDIKQLINNYSKKPNDTELHRPKRKMRQKTHSFF